MRKAFGTLLKDPEILALSIDDSIRMSQKANGENSITARFLEELLWEKMGDNTITKTGAHSLIYAYNIQQMIARQPLQEAIPDPQQDPFFWALVCQRAPQDPRVEDWQSKIPSLLKPQEKLGFLLSVPPENYAEIVKLLKLQDSAKSRWAKHRLEALQYLASLQKSTK